MTDKVQKIREEVERLKSQLLRCACSSQIAMETYCKEEAYNEVLSMLDTLQEEPVSDECIYNRTLEERQRSCKFCSAACQVRIKEEPVSEDLEEALAREWHGYNDRGAATVDALEDNTQELTFAKGFYLGAQWQKANLWKPADGDDLPEYDREVIVLIKYEEYPTYRVGFGHRPNPDGWDGKNIDTNEVTHYTPKLYNKGGWNAPDIVYWLDVELPKEIEL